MIDPSEFWSGDYESYRRQLNGLDEPVPRPAPQGRPATTDAGTRKRLEQEERQRALQGVDPRSWTTPAPPRRWIVPGWIPRGEVTLLMGNGGVGKSLIAQQLLTAAAANISWLGLHVEPCAAYGFFCEDTSDEHHRRQDAINSAHGISMADLGNLRLASWAAEDAELGIFDPADVLKPTPLFQDLLAALKPMHPGVIVLDTLADIFAGDELKRQHARQFIRKIGGTLAQTLDAAVIICGHPSQSGIREGTGTSGSTGWRNTARSQLYLTRGKDDDQDDNVRILSRPKANYSQSGSSTDLHLRWDAGVIMPADAPPAANISWHAVEATFDEIERGWNARTPWSNAPQTKRAGRYLPAWMNAHTGIAESAASNLIGKWIMNGYLAIDVANARNGTKGLKLIRRITQP